MLSNVFGMLERKLADIGFGDSSYLSEDVMAKIIENGFQNWADERELAPHGEFLIKELQMQSGDHILDLACGDGRYSFLLCERGFAVTGVDCTEALISYLRAKNSTAGLGAIFVKSDMSEIGFAGEFDHAIILGNSLGLVSEESATKALMRVCSALKPVGRMFLEMENKIHFIRTEAYSKEWQIYNGRYLILSEVYYEDIQGLEKMRDICVDRETGEVSEFQFVKRQYSFEEIREKLGKTGFRINKAFGDWNGSNLTHLSPKILIVAEKM